MALNFRFALLVLLAAASAVPAAAAPPPPRSPAAAANQMQAVGAWMQRIAQAMAPMNDASARFGAAMKELFAQGGDPSRLRERASAMRSAVAEARQAILNSQAELARVPRFEGGLPGLGHVDPNRLLIDARAQADRTLAYLDDADALAAAAERSDVKAVQAAAAKVMRGGFLLIDSQLILFRGRQSLFPPDRSVHQLLAITIQLYRAMGVSADAWYKARLEAKPEQAASTQREAFLALADELEASLRQGRANLARESARLAADKPRAMREPSLARIVTATENVLAIEGRSFTIGDELLAWLRAHADASAATLQAQAGPDFILELSVFEQRLLGNAADSAAVLSEGGADGPPRVDP
jgi:hypothetical protein